MRLNFVRDFRYFYVEVIEKKQRDDFLSNNISCLKLDMLRNLPKLTQSLSLCSCSFKPKPVLGSQIQLFLNSVSQICVH